MKLDHGDGHIISPHDLYDDAVNLLLFCQAFYSCPFERKDINENVAEYIYAMFDYRLSALLMNVAVKLRVLDDQFTRILEGYKSMSSQEFSCGTFKDQKKLSLRDACNKIIHCEAIKSFPIPLEAEEVPKIHLKDSNWEVTIDITQFTNVVFDYLDQADECLANH